MHFAWIRSWEANMWLLHELLLTHTYEFLATKAPKRQIGLPTVVKTTCSPLPFFSPFTNGTVPLRVLRRSVHNSQSNQ